MRGMVAVKRVTEGLIRSSDLLVYEFCEMGTPEKDSDLAFGTSVAYPGKVGNEHTMTKGHFHTILATAEVFYCLSEEGFMRLENPEGDWNTQSLKPGVMVYA